MHYAEVGDKFQWQGKTVVTKEGTNEMDCKYCVLSNTVDCPSWDNKPEFARGCSVNNVIFCWEEDDA